MAGAGKIESDASDTVVCLVTAPPAHADQIATTVIEKGLGACVNIVPLVQSVYRWEGSVERDHEALLIVKTTRTAVPRIDELLRTVHPYDTFELVALDVAAGSLPYLQWIAATVDGGSATGCG